MTKLNINNNKKKKKEKKNLSLIYLQTPTIINSLHLHIKRVPSTIPPNLTTTVNIPKNIK